MNINKDSWHHQLFTIADRNKYEKNSNVCKYIRGVLAGMFLTLFIVTILSAGLIGLLDPILSGLAYWITGISYISFFGVVFGAPGTLILGYVLYTLIGVFTAAFGVHILYGYLKDKYAPMYDDSKLNNFADVVGASIKSKHDKICLNIKIVG